MVNLLSSRTAVMLTGKLWQFVCEKFNCFPSSYFQIISLNNKICRCYALIPSCVLLFKANQLEGIGDLIKFRTRYRFDIVFMTYLLRMNRIPHFAIKLK